jgi:hypothetical protein
MKTLPRLSIRTSYFIDNENNSFGLKAFLNGKTLMSFINSKSCKILHTSSTDTQETRHLISNANVKIHAKNVSSKQRKIIHYTRN